MAGFVSSPRNESHAIFSDSMGDVDLSVLQSFVAPQEPNLLKPKSKQRVHVKTPSRQIFGDRTNRPRNEFTPLLKSVHKSTMQEKINAAVERTPKFMNYDKEDVTLPRGDSSGIESSSYNDENTPLAPIQNIDSSGASTPLPAIRGKGVLDDGQLTLREQEKIIDDIKKENFGLKLKIFFLDDRLKKLGPEFNDVAIKENVELKVEHATLRAELKRYKKSLLDSEKAIAELRQDTLGLQDKAKQRFADSKEIERNAQQLQESQERLEQKEDELMTLQENYDRLRLELEDRDKTEEDDATEIDKLRQKVEQLEEEKDDLEADLRAKDQELDEREDKDENENHNLRQRIQELEEALQIKEDNNEENQHLEQENERLQNNIEDLKQESDDLERVLQSKDEEKNDLVRKHEEQCLEFEHKMEQAKEKIQSLHSDKKSLQTQITTLHQEREGADNDLGDQVLELQTANKDLEHQYVELEQKFKAASNDISRLHEDIKTLKASHKDQLEELRDDIRERSLTMKSRVQERDENRHRLQKELDKLQVDLATMTSLHQEKAQEATSAKKRVDELMSNYTGDAKSMQSELSSLRSEKEQLSRLHSEVESQKQLLQLRHDSLTTESQQLQRDVQKLERSLENFKATLAEEREAVNLREQKIRNELASEKNLVEEAMDKLQLSLDEQMNSREREHDHWNSEKRQLETKLSRAETKCQNLESTVNNMRESGNSMHGTEMRFASELSNMEKQHQQETDSLNQQIRDLNTDIKNTKVSLEKKSTELQTVREELRLAQKSHKSFEEKARALEDDLEYLTQQHEEETDGLKDMKAATEARNEKLQRELKESKELLTSLQSQLNQEHSKVRSIEDAQNDAESQLRADLDNVEVRLESMKKDKQQFQEQLSKANDQLKSMKSLTTELEMERDDLKAQVFDLGHQIGSSLKLDQEKLELRKAKGRLEIELRQVTEERNSLESKSEELELQLEEAFNQAVSQEKELENEIANLRKQISNLTTTNDRAKAQSKKDISRLEANIQELNDQLMEQPDRAEDFSELSNIKNDLLQARRREQEFSDREAGMKEKVRDLRQRVQRLETELHEARIARPRSPNDTQTQVERQELHQHLIKARLQIEELQNTVQTKESELQNQAAQDAELQSRLKMLRQERMQIADQAAKSDRELEKSQNKLERVQQKFTELQQAWESERKKIVKKVQSYTNNEQDRQNAAQELQVMETAMSNADKKHRAEIKGLATQIKYLRAKMTREEGFRKDLCFTKNFFLMQINLYGACNEANLQLLKQMGISPDRRIREKRPTLKSVGHAVIASIRMRKRQQDWSENESLKMALAKSLDQVRRRHIRS